MQVSSVRSAHPADQSLPPTGSPHERIHRTSADDPPGRRPAASKARRGAARNPCHRAHHERNVRRSAAARQSVARRRGLDPLAVRRRARARSTHHARDRRRGLDQHDVLWPPAWPARGARGPRARRVRRSVDLLFPDRSEVRNECAAVWILEPIDRDRVRQSPRERTDLHDRRGPLAMLIRRRDVLKAVAATALAGFAQDAYAHAVLIPNEGKTAMTSRPLMTVNIAAAPFFKHTTIPQIYPLSVPEAVEQPLDVL